MTIQYIQLYIRFCERWTHVSSVELDVTHIPTHHAHEKLHVRDLALRVAHNF